MLNVTFSIKAEFEYNEIWRYIAQDNLYYANEVLDTIDDSIDKIMLFPFIWQEIETWIRRIVDPKYKFKIIYEIKWNTIYIVSIFKYKNLWE
jgi:plasmid stabilization system protein ParE